MERSSYSGWALLERWSPVTWLGETPAYSKTAAFGPLIHHRRNLIAHKHNLDFFFPYLLMRHNRCLPTDSF